MKNFHFLSFFGGLIVGFLITFFLGSSTLLEGNYFQQGPGQQLAANNKQQEGNTPGFTGPKMIGIPADKIPSDDSQNADPLNDLPIASPEPGTPEGNPKVEPEPPGGPKAGVCSMTKPDLVIDQVYPDPVTNSFIVVVSNQGRGIVDGTAKIKMTTNLKTTEEIRMRDAGKFTFSLDCEEGRAFIVPFASLDQITSFTALTDSTNTVTESNEGNNLYSSKTL